MVAPSITSNSGGAVFTSLGWTGSTIPASVSGAVPGNNLCDTRSSFNGVYDGSALQLRQDTGIVVGTLYGAYLAHSAQNLSAAKTCIAGMLIEMAGGFDTVANNGIQWALISGAANGYKIWTVGGGNFTSKANPTGGAIVEGYPFVISASATGNAQNNFDLTNVTGQEIAFKYASSSLNTTEERLFTDNVGLIASPSAINGELSDPASLNTFFNYFNFATGTVKSGFMFRLGTGSFLSVLPLQFGRTGQNVYCDLTDQSLEIYPASTSTDKFIQVEDNFLGLEFVLGSASTCILVRSRVSSNRPFHFRFAGAAGATITIRNTFVNGPGETTLDQHWNQDGGFWVGRSEIQLNGATLSDVVITEGTSSGLLMGLADSLTNCTINGHTGAGIRITAAGDYSENTATLANNGTYDVYIDATITDGQAVDISGLAFAEGSTTPTNIYWAGTTGAIAVTVGQAGLSTDSAGGTITLTEPATQIVVSGIPEVAGAILAVVDLSDDSVTYPTLSSGGANIPTDALKSYRLIAKAPGYERQSVTLAGTGGTFEFELGDNTTYYNAAASTAEITIDYDTYTITVGDGVSSLTFEILFSSLEDLFSTEEGVLNDAPPYPVVVANRQFLIFPQSGGSPSDVTIIPDPANLSDPTITDCVLIKLGETDEVWDLFDFSGASGRIIKIQSESVAATVEGSSLSPTQATWLQNLHDTLASAGIFSSTALQNAPSTAIDAQDVADALKLAPAAGTVATGSVYNLLNVLDTNVDSLIVGVNVATVGGNVVEDAFDPATDAVTVGTNNDKSGYSLTQSFPANFSQLGISVEGYINRVVSNADMRGTDGALLTGDYTAPDNTAIADIKTKTDQLTFTVANQVDANALTGGGGDDAETIFTYFSGQGYTATRAGYLDKLNLPGSLTQTSDLPANFANLAIAETTGLVSIGTLPTIPTNWLTAAGIAADTIAEIQSGLSTLTEDGVRSAVGLLTANLDTQLAAIGTDIDAVLVDTGTAIPNTLATLLTSVNDLPDDVAAQSAIAQLISQVDRVHLIHGLEIGTPLVVSETARTAGDIAQTISTVDDITTVTRTA